MRSSGPRRLSSADPLTGAPAARILPPTEHALLLRACVASGDEGARAYAAWTQATGGALAGLRDPEVKRAALMPALLEAVTRNGIDPGRDVLSVLRAARAHEELRAATMQRAVGEVLGAAAEPPLVVGGVAAAAVAYDDWPLRHCHDLDLLGGSRGETAVHRSGLPVVRHAALYPPPFHRRDLRAVRDRAVDAEIGGAAVRVLAPPDALAHVLGRAACGQTTLRWALDAWWIVRGGPVASSVVAGHAAAAGLAAPMAVLARWLADELGAPLGRDVARVRGARRGALRQAPSASVDGAAHRPGRRQARPARLSAASRAGPTPAGSVPTASR